MTRAFPSWLLPAMPLLVVLAWGSAASSEPPDYARTPVLFVHGHGLSSADWRPLIEHLAVTGYPREYLHAVDIVPNTMANARAATSVIAPEAEALLARAEAAARRAGYSGKVSRRLDIVSHSMGVVSSRWYAAKLRPDLARAWIGLDGAGVVPVTVPAGVPAEETSPGNFLFRARVGHDPLLNHPDLMRLVAAMLAVRDRE